MDRGAAFSSFGRNTSAPNFKLDEEDISYEIILV